MPKNLNPTTFLLDPKVSHYIKEINHRELTDERNQKNPKIYTTIKRIKSSN